MDMNFTFNHEDGTLGGSLGFINKDLPKSIRDAFNKCLDNQELDCKSKILEGTLQLLKDEGLLKTPQDAFNVGFILGQELKESEIHNRMKDTMDKMKKTSIGGLIKNVKVEEIINKKALLELAKSDEPDDF